MARLVRHHNCIIEFDDDDIIISMSWEKQEEEKNKYEEVYEVEDDSSEEFCDEFEDDSYSTKRFFSLSWQDLIFVFGIILCWLFAGTLIIKSCSAAPTSDICETSATSTVTTTTASATDSSIATTTSSAPATTTSTTTTTATTTTAKSISDTNIVNVSEDTLYFLAGVIFFEQGDYSREGQIAVGHIILNRMKNDYTEERLLKELTKSGAFSSVSKRSNRWEGDGIYSNILQSFSYNGTTYYTKKPTEQSLEVARLLLAGKTENPIGTRDSFREKSYYAEREDGDFEHIKDATTIGDNTFFTFKNKPNS